MKLNIDEVERIKERIREINSVPFEEIEWFKDGKKIDTEQQVENWKFTGLSNFSFIDFWDGKKFNFED